MQRKRFEPGEEVISQGDVGDAAYVIESGRLEVLKDGVKVDELAEGDLLRGVGLAQWREKNGQRSLSDALRIDGLCPR
jgi:CRP-like cAMP-binding protein